MLFIEITFFVQFAVLIIGSAKGVHAETLCIKALKNFTHSNSAFEECALNNYVESKVCFNCVAPFIVQKIAYAKLLEAHDSSDKGNHLLCSKQFLNKDKFDLVRNHYEKSKTFWIESSCKRKENNNAKTNFYFITIFYCF